MIGIRLSNVEIQSLPLMQRRRLLGYIIPAINVPLFFYNLYQAYNHVLEGMIIPSQIFWEDIIVLVSTLILALLVARAQRDFVTSQITEIEAAITYLKALIELYRLEGSLLERRGITAPGREPVDLVLGNR